MPIVDPKGQKRPADLIGNAFRAMLVVTSEAQEESDTDDRRDPAARALGSRVGKARAKPMAPEGRTEVAKEAAASGRLK